MPDDDRRPEDRDEEARKRARDEEEEGSPIVVRDRRRVTTEGDLREVEDDERRPTRTPPPPPEPQAAAAAPAPSAEEPAAPPRRERPAGSSALGGAEAAQARRERTLQEVPPPTDEEQEEDGEERRRIDNVYEYVQAVTSEMIIWSLAALGLVPNPLTQIVTTDLDQAHFAIATAEKLIEHLSERGAIDEESEIGLLQAFVVQFGSVAAQLLNQPPAQRLQEVAKIRFCIDTADQFVSKLEAMGDPVEATQLAELKRFLGELRMAFIQASGGGGIIG